MSINEVIMIQAKQ